MVGNSRDPWRKRVNSSNGGLDGLRPEGGRSPMRAVPNARVAPLRPADSQLAIAHDNEAAEP
jgi:hypothetical protein